VEVGLAAWPGVSALEVGRELAAQLWPGVESPLGQVHEPRPGRPGQGNREVVGHNGLIPPPCRKDRGGVNLQEQGARVICLTCGWTPTRWRVRVKIFFKIATLDISMPLAPALDGDSAIFPTAVTVDFSPEVGLRVTCHWRAVPRCLAGIWPDGRRVLDRRCTGYGRRMCRWGVRILR
jgi:hypothetical protein